MQNHKIETYSELIYEDGSIWSTSIFIKIIGSDTLWFPSPPSEGLFKESHIRIIPTKFGKNPTSSLGGDVLWNYCWRRTTHDGHPTIIIAHHEPMAQVG